jgi:hypothetical protein
MFSEVLFLRRHEYVSSNITIWKHIRVAIQNKIFTVHKGNIYSCVKY